MDRRKFLSGAGAAGAAALATGCGGTRNQAEAKIQGPSLAELDRVAAAPVLKQDGLTSPVIIDSVRYLKKGSDYLVHVRSKDGAEGVSMVNPPKGEFLGPVFKQLVAPFFVGKDARDLENHLWELYRWKDNYKLYGICLWSPQAWMEFAILDMLGRIVHKPMGALVGDIVRQQVPFYIASGRRDTTPDQEIEYLKMLVDRSGAKALKFRVGGRMSRNADAMPGRTETLIPLVRKTFGDAMVIQADSNSSYDPPKAIEVGRLLESIKAVHYEEPCPFDHLEDTKLVADTLDIPVALGEQEYSDWRFRWIIANRAADIIQPDLFYYGGMVRSMRVARMANLAKLPITAHLSEGPGFVYVLHYGAVVPQINRQEYKLGLEKYGAWFDPPIKTADGNLSLPTGPGLGIKDIKGLLADAVEA